MSPTTTVAPKCVLHTLPCLSRWSCRIPQPPALILHKRIMSVIEAGNFLGTPSPGFALRRGCIATLSSRPPGPFLACIKRFVDSLFSTTPDKRLVFRSALTEPVRPGGSTECDTKSQYAPWADAGFIAAVNSGAGQCPRGCVRSALATWPGQRQVPRMDIIFQKQDYGDCLKPVEKCIRYAGHVDARDRDCRWVGFACSDILLRHTGQTYWAGLSHSGSGHFRRTAFI